MFDMDIEGAGAFKCTMKGCMNLKVLLAERPHG